MTILLSIVLGVVVWFVLMLMTTNVIGIWFTVWIRHSIRGTERRTFFDYAATLIASTLVLTLLFLMGVYLNLMFSLAAIILMICRLPDLAWEMEHGRSIELGDMPRTKSSYALTLLSWLALPITCYGVYLMLR